MNAELKFKRVSNDTLLIDDIDEGSIRYGEGCRLTIDVDNSHRRYIVNNGNAFMQIGKNANAFGTGSGDIFTYDKYRTVAPISSISALDAETKAIVDADIQSWREQDKLTGSIIDQAALGQTSFVAGYGCLAADMCDIAVGWGSGALGGSSFAAGYGCQANGLASTSLGYGTSTPTSVPGSCAVGQLNAIETNVMFVVGGGKKLSSGETRATIFKVSTTGQTYAKSTTIQGCDYAELFEWADSNPDNEDRVGKFVTLVAPTSKIKYADENDYILGVTSSNPSVIGNGDISNWNGMYEKDVFDRVQHDDDGQPIVSDEYDSTREYVNRIDRPEWSPVGMVGVLKVYDDGTCIPGKFCKPSHDGIGTASDNRSDYYVIERVTDNIVKIVIK